MDRTTQEAKKDAGEERRGDRDKKWLREEEEEEEGPRMEVEREVGGESEGGSRRDRESVWEAGIGVGPQKHSLRQSQVFIGQLADSSGPCAVCPCGVLVPQYSGGSVPLQTPSAPPVPTLAKDPTPSVTYVSPSLRTP